MDKFGAAVMKVANSATSSALTPAQKSLIQNRLAGFFSEFRTPYHPPYAAMIHRAIRELNELGGSSEESISKFMKEEYHELPWSHFTLLKHHLGELCDCGEIVVARNQCYLLAGANPNLNSSTGPTREHLKRKRKWGWKRGCSRQRKKDETQEEQRIKKQLKVIDHQQNQCNVGQNEVIGKWNQPSSEKAGLVEEQNHLLLPDEMIEKEIQADEQQNKVIENEPHEQENNPVEGENKQNKQESGVAEDHHPLQPELYDLERPQGLKLSPIVGLAQVMDQLAKLRTWQSWNTSQTKTAMASVDSSLASQQLEPEHPPQLPCAERSPELEALKEFSQQLQLAAQEKSPRRILRPQLPEPATTTCMAKLSSQHQHKEEQQPEHRGRGRRRKAKPNTTAVESTPSDHQNQHEQKHPGHRGRGKPCNGKLEDAKTEKILSISPRNPQESQQQQEEQPKHRGRGRPPNGILVAASTEEILPNFSQKTRKERQQQEEQPQHRGDGRLPKGKLVAATIDEILSPQQDSHQQQEKQRKNEGCGRWPPKPKPPVLQSAKQQEQREKQGRGRPRKMEQGK